MAEKNYWIHIKQGDFELDVEGDKKFVESYVKSFLEEEPPAGRARTGRGPGRPRKGAGPKKPAASRRAGKSTRKTTEVPSFTKEELNKFLKGKSDKSMRNRYLLYAQFWASRGVKEVSNSHILACSRLRGYKEEGQGRQYFSIFSRTGLMKAGSKRGLWKLTKAGLEEETLKKKKEAPAKKKTGRKAKPGRKAKARAKKKVKAKPKKKTGAKKVRKTTKPKTRRREPKSLDEVLGKV